MLRFFVATKPVWALVGCRLSWLVNTLFRRGKRRFSGLDSLVSFSSCLIAANRAVESEQADPYLLDALAAGLCGEAALEARRDLNRRSEAASAVETEGGRRPIPRLIMRALFFDDVAMVAAWAGEGPAGPAAAHSCHAALAALVRGAAGPIRQVVLLGSGLDTRPWRLALPAGVRWWEVDRRDVLAAKRRGLRALGAGLAPPRRSAQPPPDADLQGGVGAAAAGQQRGQQQQQKGHPLRAASWRTVATDLARPGWSRRLVRSGLDPAAPVVWVLEGLLYYLEEKDVRALLQEAASASGAGSVLAASLIHRAPPPPPPTPTPAPPPEDAAVPAGPAAGATAAGATAAASPSPAPEAAHAAARAAAAAEAASGPAAQAPEGADSAQGGRPPAAGAAAARAAPAGGGGETPRGAGYNLLSEFKWYCEVEPRQFFAECGWRSLSDVTWVEAARSYGHPTREQRASVRFLTAAKA